MLDHSTLYRLRPSDRHNMYLAPVAELTKAVDSYLRGWEKSDWLDDYRVERLGQWLRTLRPETVPTLLALCRDKKSAAYEAFQIGLTK